MSPTLSTRPNSLTTPCSLPCTAHLQGRLAPSQGGRSSVLRTHACTADGYVGVVHLACCLDLLWAFYLAT